MSIQLPNRNSSNKYSTLKSVKTDICSTSRMHSDQKSSPLNREWFTKMQKLEFQNDLFQMKLKHIDKRKQNEEDLIKSQLNSLQHEVDYLRLANLPVPNQYESVTHDSDSELSSRSNSSSSSERSKYFQNSASGYQSNSITNHKIKHNNDGFMKTMQRLYDVCHGNSKLDILLMQYCGPLKTVLLEITSQNYVNVLDNVVKMLIDLIKRFSSIKVENMVIRDTPNKSVTKFEFETFNKEKLGSYESLSPAFNSQDENDFRPKLSEQYDRTELVKKESDPKTIQTIASKKVSTSELARSDATSRRASRLQRVDLMPSLKQKRMKPKD